MRSFPLQASPESDPGLEVERATREWEPPRQLVVLVAKVLQAEYHIKVTGDGLLGGQIDEGVAAGAHVRKGWCRVDITPPVAGDVHARRGSSSRSIGRQDA